MSEVVSWLVRYGHVLGAAVWTGGYATLALVIVPLLEKGASADVARLAVATVRVGTYAGTLVIGFGVVLIGRTNGYGHLLGTAWGTLVLASAATAVVLFGIGDGALRPALVRLAAGGDGRAARRWSLADDSGLRPDDWRYLRGVSGRAQADDGHWLLRCSPISRVTTPHG